MQCIKTFPNATLKKKSETTTNNNLPKRPKLPFHHIPLNVLLLALRLSLLDLPLAESLPFPPSEFEGRFFSTLVGAKVTSLAPTASPLPPPLCLAAEAGVREARSPNDLPARSF
jgi:hypothetical protein